MPYNRMVPIFSRKLTAKSDNRMVPIFSRKLTAKSVPYNRMVPQFSRKLTAKFVPYNRKVPHLSGPYSKLHGTGSRQIRSENRTG